MNKLTAFKVFSYEAAKSFDNVKNKVFTLLNKLHVRQNGLLLIVGMLLFSGNYVTAKNNIPGDSSAVLNKNFEGVDSIFDNMSYGDTAKMDSLLETTKRLINENSEKVGVYLQKIDQLTETDSLSDNRIMYYLLSGLDLLNKADYRKSVKLFMNALRIAEKTGQSALKEDAMNNLAVLFMQTGDFENGILYFDKLLKLARSKHDNKKELQYLLNLSLAYARNEQFDKAEDNLLELYDKTNEDFFKAVAANSLSYIYNVKEKYDKAAKYGKKAVELSEQNNILQLKLEAMTNYGNALLGLGKTKQAEEVMMNVAAISKENDFSTQYMNAAGNLSLIYTDLKNYEKALQYFKIFSEIKDSLLNEKISKQIQELRIKYETEKKEKELEMNRIVIREKSLKAFYFAVTAGMFALFSLLLFVLYRKKNAAYKKLVKKNMELVDKGMLVTPKSKILMNREKYKTSSLTEEKKQKLSDDLNTLMQKEKIFLNGNLTLEKLSQNMGVNSKYISQIIHEEYNCHFNDFVNKLRIQEATLMLLNDSYQYLTIEGIAKQVGFRSKSAFNTAFKKVMGVTPSFYIRTSKSITL